ncbi:MAG: DUF4256 domain-containing protein [Candidatus Peribacteraceae bacterium]|nr:DUF4256 domain-containing protein [Candidatus Peribacteraceae bacterium]
MPKTISPKERDALLKTLQARFEKHTERHRGLTWDKVAAKLKDAALWSLQQMEETGGEPDVVSLKKGEWAFVDCAEETPKGRRSLCYDDLALRARKENKPKDSAMNLTEAMGIELIDEEEYRALQELGEFDRKTSSWILTPPDIRKLGGALFCDRRYDHVFTYHNGADSYYAARAFRGKLKI